MSLTPTSPLPSFLLTTLEIQGFSLTFLLCLSASLPFFGILLLLQPPFPSSLASCFLFRTPFLLLWYPLPRRPLPPLWLYILCSIIPNLASPFLFSLGKILLFSLYSIALPSSLSLPSYVGWLYDGHQKTYLQAYLPNDTIFLAWLDIEPFLQGLDYPWWLPRSLL